MDRGLWRYTRHPNYFGDCCVWWGLYAIAAATPLGVWTLASPIAMTFLLLRVSGVALLERSIGKRRPEYAEYAARTSAFVPWPPRQPRERARSRAVRCGVAAAVAAAARRVPDDAYLAGYATAVIERDLGLEVVSLEVRDGSRTWSSRASATSRRSGSRRR